LSRLVFLIALFSLLVGSARAGNPVPLLHAHSHNDNERSRPLEDALEHGFCSIEADVNLIDGELRLGHTSGGTRPGFTLESAYLEPLRARVRANGGKVYPNGPTVQLLIDVKTDADATYAVLRETLSRYSEMLTEYREGGDVVQRAVSVVISGEKPRRSLPADRVRFAAIDGDLEDLDGGSPATIIPLVSEDWRFLFSWHGGYPLPAPAADKLRELVAKAHAQGRRIRFYAAPDRELAWKTFRDAGVDLINTDSLDELRDYLLTRPDR
jgi:hypothetical protein